MHFQVVPVWAEEHRDAWEWVARNFRLKEDRDFAARAEQNATNRGHDGTHCAGSRNFERFKAMMVCIYMERPAFNPRRVPTSYA